MADAARQLTIDRHRAYLASVNEAARARAKLAARAAASAAEKGKRRSRRPAGAPALREHRVVLRNLPHELRAAHLRRVIAERIEEVADEFVNDAEMGKLLGVTTPR